METSPVRRSVGTLLLGSLPVLAFVGARAEGDPPAAATASASLSGVVVDETGAPIGGAEVAAYDAFAHLRRLTGGGSLEEPTPLGAAAHGTADAKGRFTLGGLERAAYTFVASAPGHGVGYLEGFPAAPSGAPMLVVTLGPGVAVEGDVVDAAGKGIASVPVAVGVGFEREVSWASSVFARAYAATDAAGHFRVDGVPTHLPAQRKGVSVHSYSVCAGGPGEWRCHRFLLDGVPHAPVRIRFGGTAVVVGTIRDADGDPAGDARVVVRQRPSRDAMQASGEPDGSVTFTAIATSGSDGSFRVADALPGASIEVVAYAGGRGVGAERADAAAQGGTAAVDVALLSTTRATGLLWAPDGTPVPNAEVFALVGNGPVWTTRTDSTGRWALNGLTRQGVHLAVAASGLFVPEQLTSLKSVGDAAAKEPSHDVRLAAAADVAGRVLDATGVPVPGARVRVRPIGNTDRRTADTQTGLDGSFLALGLEAGDVIVTVEPGDGSSGGEATATLVAGRTVPGTDVRFEVALPDPAKSLDAGARPETATADLRTLVEVVRVTRVDARRAQAVDRLRAVGSRGSVVVSALAALLRQPWPVGRDAAYVLSAMGDAGALALATSLAADVVAAHDTVAQMLAGMEGIPSAARPALLRRLRDGAPTVRASCATALGRVTPADAETIQALTSALADADVHVVREALEAITRLAPHDPGVARALRPLLARSDVRRPALLAAKALGPAAEALTPDLLRALRAETDHETRLSLADALGSIGKAAIPPVVAFLHEGGGADEAARRSGFLALSAMRTDAVDALLELAVDRDPGLRAGAIRAIRGAGPRLSRVVAVLASALDDADSGVRLAAAERLGYLGSNATAAVPALRARLQKGAGDEDATTAVIEALGAIGVGSKPAVPELTMALAGPSRWAAAEALGRVGDASAVPALVSALGEDAGLEERVAAAIARVQKDPQSAEATEALEALDREGAGAKLDARFGVAVALLRLDPTSKEARVVLLARLHDADSAVRARVIAKLAQAGPSGRDLVEPLDRIASDDLDDTNRAAACGALAALGATDKAIATLRPLLASEHIGLAREAAEAVRRLGPAAAPLVPDVLRLIDDAHRFMDRGTWIGSLGALGTSGDVVVAPLAGFLADSAALHRESRDAAAVALLELHRRVDASMPIVAARLEEFGYPLLPRAIAALSDLGPKAATAAPALERLTDHRDGSIREAAYAALRRVSGK